MAKKIVVLSDLSDAPLSDKTGVSIIVDPMTKVITMSCGGKTILSLKEIYFNLEELCAKVGVELLKPEHKNILSEIANREYEERDYGESWRNR